MQMIDIKIIYYLSNLQDILIIIFDVKYDYHAHNREYNEF